MKKVSRENLDALFAAIAEAKKLYLPVADSTDEKRSAKYTVWTPKTKYASEAVNTVRSAKDFFFPQVENMVNFKVNGKKIEVDDIRTECEDFVIFGVRACDAASFKILDSVYLSEPVDTFYQNRREHGVVMTMSCTKPSETCFCSVFGIDAAEPAGDVSCWMTDDAVLMQANTEKGEALLASLPMLEDAADDAAEESKAKTKAILEKLPLKNLSTDSFGGDKLMELFNSAWAAEPVPSFARPASAMISVTMTQVTAFSGSAAGTAVCTPTLPRQPAVSLVRHRSSVSVSGSCTSWFTIRQTMKAYSAVLAAAAA